ncbi:MAG: DUF4236 domain-containing protein [Phycisphaerales bacterium]|nr:DUF4236 domain-containing protein [Phycisphaerales bacterium]
MGFIFRRSANVGPFRLNLSKSGLGWSVGGRGFRTGRSATGRKYSTFGIPGTGIGYRSGKGCLLFLAPTALIAVATGYAIFSRWNYA